MTTQSLNNQRYYRLSVRTWLKDYWLLIVIVLGGLAMENAIFISKAFRQSTTVDPEAAARLGSFVGGYIGTIFALIGVALLFVTLRTQKQSFEKQSFENKYFELIKLHRENVAEADLGDASGRKVFVFLLREFRCILDVVRRLAESCNQQLTAAQLRHVAYYCLFYGVGPNSSRMLKISLSNFDPTFITAVEEQLNDDGLKDKIRRERSFPYKPFEGHQSRLGHYYRHLFQMVRYVDESPLTIDKYAYMKTIRAQLSTHEQSMLLVNSLTPLGRVWWSKRLILEYSLVKNIPREFFDPSTELDTGTLFPEAYFEWEENQPE